MPTLKVTTEDPESLIQDPENVRTHPARNLDAIRRSIKRFGVRRPIVAREGSRIVYAGNGVLQAAIALKLTEIPVAWIPEEVSETVARAYAIADNQTGVLSAWDTPKLGAALEELKALDFDLIDMGFDDEAFDDVFMGAVEAVEVAEDEFDNEPRPDPCAQPGDLWHLGRHRLVCGDCADTRAVGRLPDASIAMVFTSPPYAQQRDYDNPIDDWTALMRGMTQNIPAMDTTQLLVNLGVIYRDNEWVEYWREWLDGLKDWRRFAWYVWDKLNGLPGDWRGRLAPSFEFIFHLNRENVCPRKWIEKHKNSITARTRVWIKGADGKPKRIDSPDKSLQPHKISDAVVRLHTEQIKGMEHPAIFPIGLPSYFIQSYSDPKDYVYDPFLGSGTTLIACEQLERTCYGLEISPGYCDIIVNRFVKYTGDTETVSVERDGTTLRYEEVFTHESAQPLPAQDS